LEQQQLAHLSKFKAVIFVLVITLMVNVQQQN